MQFTKIGDPRKKSAYVAEQVLCAIKDGTYRVGDKLPAERELAEQVGVSRNSVREALSALQIIGIIESRAGDGTYIRKSAGDRLEIGQALILVKEGKNLLEIWEARREIETSLVKLAIDRASPQAIDKIEVILGRMREATRAKDSVEYLSANRDFHVAIAEAADNPPLRNALCALMEIITQQLLEKVNLGYVLESIEKSLNEHRDILGAIKDQDKEAGAKTMKVHFEELEKYLKRRYDE